LFIFGTILFSTVENRDIYVILADDDRDDRRLFREAVSGHTSVRIEDVEDGASLLSRLQSSDTLPDLVMLDLNMPVMNGKECLRTIRNNEKLKDLPVVIYSTSSSRKDIDETQKLGANLFVTKPLSFPALKKMAGKLFEIDWKSQSPGASRGGYVLSA
jgi:CheY-like chemotaxis protein